MSVRIARPPDREALLALWDAFSGGDHPAWVEDAREGTAAALDESIALGLAFVAEEHGEALGFAAAVPRGNRAVELTELYVRPEERGRGLAGALAGAVRAAAAERGARFVFVSTGPENHAARAVYERWGFRPNLLEYVAAIDELDL